MITRTVFVLGAVALAIALYYAFKHWQMTRISQRLSQPLVGTTAVATQPTLLYFRSESCTVCPTQSHYIDKAAQDWNGRIVIQKIDAEREPEKADIYNVFTLPTTIFVDTHGQVREINYGLTQPHKLTQQVQGIL